MYTIIAPLELFQDISNLLVYLGDFSEIPKSFMVDNLGV